MKKRSVSYKQAAMLASIALSFLFLTLSVFAQTQVPGGPDTISPTGKGRHQNNSEPVAYQAQAGNVTALVISTVRSTAAWQGYYGNVTGTIVLDDANNQTLYDWSLPDPRGEIYASNGTIVNWANIYCMNVSHSRPFNGTQPGASGNGNAGGIVYSTNGTGIELRYGINESDRDGLNETFNDTYTDATGFRVGSITIDSTDGCSLAHPYANELYLASGWQEVLLSDNASIIFTAIIRENADAYHTGSEPADFQLMVLENGHAGHENTLSTYYFFVELT